VLRSDSPAFRSVLGASEGPIREMLELVDLIPMFRGQPGQTSQIAKPDRNLLSLFPATSASSLSSNDPQKRLVYLLYNSPLPWGETRFMAVEWYLQELEVDMQLRASGVELPAYFQEAGEHLCSLFIPSVDALRYAIRHGHYGLVALVALLSPSHLLRSSFPPASMLESADQENVAAWALLALLQHLPRNEMRQFRGSSPLSRALWKTVSFARTKSLFPFKICAPHRGDKISSSIRKVRLPEKIYNSVHPFWKKLIKKKQHPKALLLVQLLSVALGAVPLKSARSFPLKKLDQSLLASLNRLLSEHCGPYEFSQHLIVNK